jgi:hypothetical protein
VAVWHNVYGKDPAKCGRCAFLGKCYNGHTKKCVAGGENCKTSQKAVLKNETGLKLGILVVVGSEDPLVIIVEVP